MILIDSDNAMGSRSGDVDDAFAIAALVRSTLPIAAISSVAGNTTEPLARDNNRRLCELLGGRGALLPGEQGRELARTFEGRIAALGPLTNVVGAERAAEIVIVGGNLTSRGRWPPLWPHEFNLTKDRDAARRVFASNVPLTIFPLDVCRGLWIRERDLDSIPGLLGDYLRVESRRWFARLLRVRLRRRFAIYDLAAALYLAGEEGLTMRETTAAMRANTFLEFGRGVRPVKVCVALERQVLWRRFLELVT